MGDKLLNWDDRRPPTIRSLLCPTIGFHSHFRRNHLVQFGTCVAINNYHFSSLNLLQHLTSLFVSPYYCRCCIEDKNSSSLATELLRHYISDSTQCCYRYSPRHRELQIYEKHLRFDFSFDEHMLSHVEHYEPSDPNKQF